MPADDTDDALIENARTVFTNPFGGVIRIETEGGPAFHVDGRGEQVSISRPAPADEDAHGEGRCVWRASRETLTRIFDGERQLGSAYLSGRLAIAGDMSVMARLQLSRGRLG